MSKIIRSTYYRIFPDKELLDILKLYQGASTWTWNRYVELQDTGFIEECKEKKHKLEFALLEYIRHSDNAWIADGSKIDRSVVLNEAKKFKTALSNAKRKIKEYKKNCESDDGFDPDKFKPSRRSPKSDVKSFTIDQCTDKCRIKNIDGQINVNFTKHIGRRTIKSKDKIEIPTADIKQITFIQIGDKHYMIIAHPVEKREPTFVNGSKFVIDTGVNQPLTCYDGEQIIIKDLDKRTKRILKNVRITSEMFSKTKVKSNKHKKLKGQLKNVNEYLTNYRNNWQDMEIDDILSKFEIIRIDDSPSFYKSGTKKNKKTKKFKGVNLRKRLISKGRFIQKMKERAEVRGNDVKVIKFKATTKTCSNCLYKGDKIPLEERDFECPKCGFKDTRDNNACYNLYKYY